MNLLIRGFILGSCSLLFSAHAVAEDFTINRLLASQCAQCHGTDGNAVGGIEELAGESARELLEELQEMRSEGRANDIMEHQALGYTDDQIRRIAEYYGSISGSGGGDSGGGGSSGGGSDSSGGSESDGEDERNRESEADKKIERRRERKKHDRRTRHSERDD